MGEQGFATEKRGFARFDGNFPIKLSVENPRIDILTSVAAETVNLSESGLCISLDLPLPSASIIDLQMDLPSDYSPLKVKMEVAWSRYLSGYRFRSGMRFLKMEGDRRNRVRRLIDEISTEKAKSEPEQKRTQAQPTIRPAGFEDIDEILEVEEKAWPDGLRAPREMIQSRIETFAEGFLCAAVNGKIEGFVVTEILSYDNQKDAFSWCEATDYGYIRKSHNPDGDTLYGISLSVSPQKHFRDIAAPLVEAGANLTIRRKLKQAAFGCRIPRYHKYADRLTIEEYVQTKRKNGRPLDPELEMYQKIGLRPIKVIPNYIEDPESLNYGVLLAWENPFLNLESAFRFWRNYRSLGLMKQMKKSGEN